jgi:hypothetical protein
MKDFVPCSYSWIITQVWCGDDDDDDKVFKKLAHNEEKEIESKNSFTLVQF